MLLSRRLFAGGLTVSGLAAGLAAPVFAQSKMVLKVPQDHKTIAEALTALPETGGTIEIATGTYKEKLVVAKPDVVLKGQGKTAEEVLIVWGDNAHTPRPNATLTVSGNGFRATNLTIQNDYHLKQPDVPAQALALSIDADRAVVTGVRLLGAQDTLMASSKKGPQPSRQYYKDCYIEGHVDFIFGNALAFFDRCHLHVIDRGSAFITAHSRNAETETSAYVFDHCRITTAGDGDYYFGRAWRAYGQVVFLDTRIEGNIHPEGWREWTPGKTETYTTAAFSEYNSSGPHGDMSQRVFWAKTLTAEQAAKWRLEAVFPDRSWIGAGA
ncbi:pectinesterase family protein [Asticcacaulis sp. BYS171W]|uniref:Pectinesterase family protein n=1 Tax=Asticcacaulis aquaticus TaxID=2984212 RepID=A0ABT5HVP2_9CAUL|nr:pectinesterase family protein [Asticcacaulis aquaticus]MDC7684133.1 pectinesterase family protein [Asticcacaulis aquaticus]